MNRMKNASGSGAGGWSGQPITRRTFLRSTAAFAAAGAFGGMFFRENRALAASFGDPVLVETNPRVEIKYSVCQSCHGRCGMRCKIVDGVLVKIDGNPYHPNDMEPHLPYETDLATARTVAGRCCAKGLAGIQGLYDPLRLKEPLKRVGPRGSGQWQTISWEQAFSEIGAKLAQYRDLKTPIDPSAPELGPKVNQVVFSGGRNQQATFTDVFWKNVFGTINSRHDHTSICEESHHTAHELMTGYDLQTSYRNHSKPDLNHATFHLLFGSDPCSANFPFTPIARKIINFIERGGKLYVVDPRCNIAASKGIWVPIKPGTDAALALAIGRYIVDNNLYNTAYLRRPHKNAANPTGELNFTDATLLVKIVDGRGVAFLRADAAGIPGGTSSDFVVWANGAAAKFDTVDAADLLPGPVTVNGIPCKTAFQLYVERVREKTLAEYSAICGVDVATIQKLATEFVAAGRRGSVGLYRGPAQHTNGVYTCLSILALNLLVGNINWKGGLSFGGGRWRESYAGAPEDWATVPGGVTPKGVQITRVKSKYEDSSEYAAKPAGQKYPARRPWFPLALHYNFQEIIPSIEDEYPYPIKALILYWNALPYSTPAARATWERVLADERKIELVVAIDISMCEATAWADYVLPDTTFFERWTSHTVAPTIINKVTVVRQPVVGRMDAEGNYTGVLPNTKTLEDILIGLGRAMGLPVPWKNAWDFWRRVITNAATDDNGPGLDYVLARGGRFENYERAYDGEKLRHRFSDRVFFFSEKLAKTKDSMTGRYFDGMCKYEPIADAVGNVIEPTDGQYPLHLVTYKLPWQYQAPTIRYPWCLSIQPGNFVELNSVDAAARGIRTGDQVRVTSRSSPQGAVGVARVTETVRPGVVAVSHHFGHWEMFARPHRVNGADTGFDATRGVGVAPNPIMRLDPYLKNVTLQDKIGASASFSDTGVQVTKV